MFLTSLYFCNLQYVALLCVLLILEIAAAALSFIYKDSITQLTTEQLEKTMDDYLSDPDIKESWDRLQQKVTWHFIKPEAQPELSSKRLLYIWGSLKVAN